MYGTQTKRYGAFDHRGTVRCERAATYQWTADTQPSEPCVRHSSARREGESRE